MDKTVPTPSASDQRPEAAANADAPLLEMRGISKYFPGMKPRMKRSVPAMP